MVQKNLDTKIYLKNLWSFFERIRKSTLRQSIDRALKAGSGRKNKYLQRISSTMHPCNEQFALTTPWKCESPVFRVFAMLCALSSFLFFLVWGGGGYAIQIKRNMNWFLKDFTVPIWKLRSHASKRHRGIFYVKIMIIIHHFSYQKYM